MAREFVPGQKVWVRGEGRRAPMNVWRAVVVSEGAKQITVMSERHWQEGSAEVGGLNAGWIKSLSVRVGRSAVYPCGRVAAFDAALERALDRAAEAQAIVDEAEAECDRLWRKQREAVVPPADPPATG